MIDYGLHLIENPAGTFSFVGSVPAQLAYITEGGNVVSDSEVESQLRLPAKYRTIKYRSFSTAEEAWIEASRLGYATRESR